jgi:hypothetical protein
MLFGYCLPRKMNMNRVSRLFSVGIATLLAAALATLSHSAMAQRYGYYDDYSGPQFFVGGSIGPSFFSDQSGNTASWLNSNYVSTTSLSAGDYIVSYGNQDHTELGGKVYGGAWFTPNVGAEIGYASLGRVRWWVNSNNSTGAFSVSDTGTVEPWALYESLLAGFNSYGIKYFAKAGAYEASTRLRASDFDNNSFSSFRVAQTVDNTGPMFGLGLSTPFGRHSALRVEVEDFVNVGDSSTTNLPPWRGNIVLLTAGYSYVF